MFSPYRAVNKIVLRIATDKLIANRKRIAVLRSIKTSTRYGQNLEFFNVNPGGTQNNHWVFKELIKIKDKSQDEEEPAKGQQK